MYRKLITNKFFEDNLLEKITAQKLIYIQMQDPTIFEVAANIVRECDNRADEERKDLLNETSPDILLKMLRGKCDNLNHDLLYHKILEYEQILLPKILTMLKTSLNPTFIEQAVKIIPHTEMNYSENLLKMLDEMKSPYGASLVCIALGFVADEKAIPILIKNFEYFKNFYQEKSYSQGPLYGLLKLKERFYE